MATLPFKKTVIRNFRDIGGSTTGSGKRVRRGLIFRSAALDNLDELQKAEIARQGIKLVVDFRSGVEQKAGGELFSSEATTVWRLPSNSALGAPQNVIDDFVARSAGDAGVMCDLYRRIPYVQARAFAVLFGAIAKGQMPLVFHCAAGKDRTGVAAALLLSFLGVDEAQILEDYHKSAIWFEQTREEFLASFPDREAVLKTEPHWHSILLTRDSYIQSMLDEVKQRHGDVRGYLIQELGLEAKIIDTIPARLLE